MATKIALIDYGIGNLRSVEKALGAVGAEVTLTERAEEIFAAEKVVLPGVGAFGDGMAGLKARGLDEVVREVVARGTPLLGICVGMQVLFEVGEELGVHEGLGLLPGRVRRFVGEGLKVPQTGWNRVEFLGKGEKERGREGAEGGGEEEKRRKGAGEGGANLLDGLPERSYAYFNHSYFCDAAEAGDVVGWTDYGGWYASVVGRGRLYGVQFHPEKSQGVGLRILRNFVEKA
ncbi:MAG: imidazole glycerol phosphate synthase subunit HisH [Anaerolineales bacterium]|nr:imidazole glycerol phosphate synthase subunit HisH [Anaerolineales bacterium]